MLILILGVVIFSLAHSVPMLPATRAGLVERLGLGPVKGLVSLGAAVGLALMIWGYGAARFDGSPELWSPPTWTRHLAITLMWPAMVMLAAAYVPPGRIKWALKHPMLNAVKFWCLAHLIANGTVADVVLFGGLLAWASVDRWSLRLRDKAAGIARPAAGPLRNDLVAIAIGTVAWAVLLLWLHKPLIGVSPLGW
ncbi:MAG: NnrU family protein [Hyphomicrobiaceae bacterium]|nr:NnrU family protein [Hyphomicrobiaceae bacterium]